MAHRDSSQPNINSVAIGGEADMSRVSAPHQSDANDPGCVKTHTVAKCRKNNSPGRHHASRVQYDLTLRYAIPSRSFYARSKGWSLHSQDPLRTSAVSYCWQKSEQAPDRAVRVRPIRAAYRVRNAAAYAVSEIRR